MANFKKEDLQISGNRTKTSNPFRKTQGEAPD